MCVFSWHGHHCLLHSASVFKIAMTRQLQRCVLKAFAVHCELPASFTWRSTQHSDLACHLLCFTSYEFLVYLNYTVSVSFMIVYFVFYAFFSVIKLLLFKSGI